MAGIDDLTRLIPVDQIAASLGVDPKSVQDGIDQALPALLGGLGANAKDPAGAASLGDALAAKDGSLIEGGVEVTQIDVADGEKIVANVFGEQSGEVAAALGAAPGSQSTDLVKRLLPLIAPIVMAYLAKKSSGSTQGGAGLDDLLGSVLGGSAGGSAGGLDHLIGGVLGGSGKGGGLGDLLGGLLGGGKR